MCRRGSALEREASRLGLALLRLPFLGEWDPVSAALLRQAAQLSEGPPVLHAHTGHTAALAVLASKAGGPPCVVHRRVDFALSGFLSRRLKYQAAGRVIAVSEAIAAILERSRLPRAKLAVVPDAVPLGDQEAAMAGVPAFGPAEPEERARLRRSLAGEWKADPESPWVGNLAALVPHKDQATLLRAAALARRTRPEALFWLIGDGPERKSLEALRDRLGLGDAVRFTGHSPRPADWLKALDVFALSSWGEGMGSVLLEALACGLPIAATSAGGVPEIVEDGRTALLAPPRDPEALAGAICRLLQEPALRGRIASAGLRSLGPFCLSAGGDAIERVYDNLYADRAHARSASAA